MQLLFLRNGFLALAFTAIASAGGLITGCTSTASQNQSQAPKETATNAKDKQMMNHGGGMTNHSMGMDLGPADANFDLRFIDAMIPHHQGAVEMANVAQQKSKRPEIKKLADNIIKSQNQEITQMKQWRQAWYPKAGDKPMAYNSQMGHMMEMSSDQMQTMMMSQDLGAADAEFDLRFINAMIPHHEGAVTMGKDALSKSKRPEIKKLAQEIIKAQDIEIKQMQQWRKAWYNK
ncbi:DUF305 domain-containing protein [Nostoc sp. 'Peltigera membranacea cyanobiont' 210A]|uniref:DUF305 domain-containing protein n=1 Tax=Nostoc sp. 'Peltigera membranacea cyanobiont' 210A TaxID=2014529 RepID=UPI000B95B4AE|nr:DUF305 domain-containing protein [Nostoc sp. 'Peltigera membranacea cyanobiont' 210A]OYD96332.1 DUF305 domain-containing protein [Nostoc sp. 'Peltigera membranacea cyanobiont' 210A]